MEQAQAFLTHFQGPQGYAFFFFLVMTCGMGFPFNSDLTLIAASVLASLGYFQLKILMILAWLAILGGDSVAFFVALKWGKQLLRVRPFSWLFTPEKIAVGENYLNTRGTKFLFIVRFLPLIRTVLFFAAGCLRVKPRTFYLMNGTASAIYVPLLMGVSYYTSENIDEVISALKRFQFGLLIAMVAIGLVVYVKRSRSKSA